MSGLAGENAYLGEARRALRHRTIWAASDREGLDMEAFDAGCAQDWVQVTGSRYCDAYGLRMAARFGEAVADAGLTLVSSGARGPAEVALRAAQGAGGRTVLFIAGCLDSTTMLGHKDVRERADLVLSLKGPDDDEFVGRYDFVSSNEAMDGLTGLMVVCQCNEKSMLAQRALNLMGGETPRPVIAVPRQAEDDRLSKGPALLADVGARLVRDWDEVPEALEEGIGLLASRAQRRHGPGRRR